MIFIVAPPLIFKDPNTDSHGPSEAASDLILLSVSESILPDCEIPTDA